MKKLDYKKMVEIINDLVKNDFLFEMDCKAMKNSKPYTQQEAGQMRDVLMKIYTIAHCYTCTACRTDEIYEKEQPMSMREVAHPILE